MLSEIRRLVELCRPNLSSYMRMPVRGEVVDVDADAYTVSVQPADANLALLPRCEILAVWATAAARLVVLPTVGDLVMVSFESGDPEKPFISGFITSQGSGESELVLEQGASRVKIATDGQVDVESDSTVNVKAATLVHVESPAKIELHAPEIELGASTLEKIIKGETFQQLFNGHQHIGNKGAPTSPPIVPLNGSELSNVTRTE